MNDSKLHPEVLVKTDTPPVNQRVAIVGESDSPQTFSVVSNSIVSMRFKKFGKTRALLLGNRRPSRFKALTLAVWLVTVSLTVATASGQAPLEPPTNPNTTAQETPTQDIPANLLRPPQIDPAAQQQQQQATPSGTSPIKTPETSAPLTKPAVAVPLANQDNGEQTPGVAPRSTEITPVTREAINQRIAAVEAMTDLDETTKAELNKRYQKILEYVTKAEEASTATAEFEYEITQGPGVIQDLKRDLSGATPDPMPKLPEETSLPQLEQFLSEVSAHLETARKEVAQIEERLKKRTERTSEIPKIAADLAKRFEEAQRQFAAPQVEGEADLIYQARHLEAQARMFSLEKQKHRIVVESKRNEVIAELLPLQRDWAVRSFRYREKEYNEWQKLVANFRKRETERQATEARRQAANAAPALKDIANRNAELAELRAEMAERIEETRTEHRNVIADLEELRNEFVTLKTKVEKSQHSATIGVLLRKQREKLPERGECEARQREIAQEIPTIQLAQIELIEERAPLSDTDAQAKTLVANLEGQIAGVDEDYIQRTVLELLQTKRDLIDQLSADYETYILDLSELELVTSELGDESREFTEFIDEHVLWIRSEEPLKLGLIPKLWNGILALCSPNGWAGVAKQAGADAFRQPIYALLVVGLGLVLFLFNHRLNVRLRKACDAASAKGKLKFFPTLDGLIVTFLLSSQWPVIAFYFGWRLYASNEQGEFGYAVASGVLLVAGLWWASAFLRQLLKTGGLGEEHFAWPAPSIRMVRRNASWFTVVGAPFAFITAFAQHYQDGMYAGSLGRLAFVIGMIFLAIFCHSVLHPKGRLYLNAGDAKPTWYRLRNVFYFVSIGAVLSLTGLAIFGYYYSATQLVVRLQHTGAAIGGLILFQAVAARWFLVKRRNLSIQQARERLASNKEAQSGDATKSNKATHPDLSVIHEQLNYMLRYAVFVGLIFSGWLIWSDVLPALKIFDRFELWSNTVEVTEMVEDADGNETLQTRETFEATTLRHAMVAALIVLITYVVGRTLPSLLAITVLERLPIDLGGRHAISVIVRYIVTLTGVILACRTMHISWSSVQWLAAAMTVGLGFGMQEIFANFVSGLIILFERPVRVGDLVTVGGVTGRVTRTQIRATTITDFDRRELIVPNKKFITDDVMNWTLSDHVNRLVIEVGVAYGSNVGLTREILLRIARDHVHVMDDPEPLVTFDRFGNSSLNFTMRCYLANLDNRLDVIHELHATIDEEFKRANIEIPFPQQDIRIRDINALARVAVEQQSSGGLISSDEQQEAAPSSNKKSSAA